jgi:protoheme IX farnesyltransferase
MKTGLEVRPAPLAAARLTDWLELTRPRIGLLVMLTTLAGFFAASAGGAFDGAAALHAMLGTGLVAGASAALNQAIERDRDARMRRTENRPVPAGRLGRAEAVVFGAALAALGVVWLAFFANALTAFLGVASFLIYVAAYTPLKPRTSFSTLVGAISGAMPPVLGWTAARGVLDLGAATLFGIMFVWQMPHFLSIAWLHREDYARGGFPFLPVEDETGARTGRQIVVWSLALIPMTLLPALLGMAGLGYLVAALALGIAWMVFAVRVAVRRTPGVAREAVWASIAYLPALLAALAADRGGPLS